MQARQEALRNQAASDVGAGLRRSRDGFSVAEIRVRRRDAHRRRAGGAGVSPEGRPRHCESAADDATTRPQHARGDDPAVDTGGARRRPHVRRHGALRERRRTGAEITACYRLVDDNPIKLPRKVPERYVAEIKVGQKVKTNVESYPGVDFGATVSRINPQIDPDNRTFSIEVLIPNDDHRLKAGSLRGQRADAVDREGGLRPAGGRGHIRGREQGLHRQG